MMIRSPESQSDELMITFSIKHNLLSALRYHAACRKNNAEVPTSLLHISNLYFPAYIDDFVSGVTANIKTMHSFRKEK